MARPKSIILVGAPGTEENQARELETELAEIERGLRSDKEEHDKHAREMKARAELLKARLTQLKNEENNATEGRDD